MKNNEFSIERESYRSRLDTEGDVFLLAKYYAYRKGTASAAYEISVTICAGCTEICCKPITVYPAPKIEMNRKGNRWTIMYAFAATDSWQGSDNNGCINVAGNVLMAERLVKFLISEEKQLFSEKWDGATTPDEARAELG